MLASTSFSHVGREKRLNPKDGGRIDSSYRVDWEGGGGGVKHDFQVLSWSNWVDCNTSAEIMARRRVGWGQDRQGWEWYRKRLHVFSLIHLNLGCL